MANLLCVPSGQVHLNSVAPAASGTRRFLAETGAKVSVQVAWTVDAATAAQAQSLVAAGQKAIGMPGMGRRRQLQTGAQCVLGQNKGALLATATAVDTCKCNGKSTKCGGATCSTVDSAASECTYSGAGGHWCYTNKGACTDGKSSGQLPGNEYSYLACSAHEGH